MKSYRGVSNISVAIMENAELSQCPNSIGCIEVTGMIQLTDEKVQKLKPIFEKILSRKYGKEVTFVELTIGKIKVDCKKVS